MNTAPMIVRRSMFMKLGMFHSDFSCVGDAGIGFDYELSIRAWHHNYTAGLYYSHFEFAIGDSKDSGTHGGVQAQIRAANELHNNARLEVMYKGFHFVNGTKRATAALQGLSQPPGVRARPALGVGVRVRVRVWVG